MDYESWFTEFKEALQGNDIIRLMWSISNAVRASFIKVIQFVYERIGTYLQRHRCRTQY